MLYLSLLSLPRHHPRWQFLQPYDLHRLLMCVLPDRHDSDDVPRLLYRHEEHDDAHSVLVQTPVSPNWAMLNGAAEVKVKSFDPRRISDGTRYRFKLRANPVVKRRGGYFSDGKPRHVLVGSHNEWVKEQTGVEPLSREQQLISWLEAKGQGGRPGVSSGFELLQQERNSQMVPACVVGPAHTYSFRRANTKRPMHFIGVDFEGVLRVTDSYAFAQILHGGIGRGKAFGFGLLSLAPPR